MNVGILGCGHVSDQYFEGMSRFDVLQIVACADLDLGRAREKAALHGVPNACPPDDLLADPSVELVVNLTPPLAHAEASIAAIGAGKHVWTEKPLASNLEDARAREITGQVTCLVGDNGAGKSTLIQILAGVHRPDHGELLVEGEVAEFRSPRDALERGISTVFQDLAMIPLISIVRNFFLGREPARALGPLRLVDWREAARIAQSEMARIGIDARNLGQPVGTLSGGERQSVAIARAIHFGARVLVLDEPTSALGLKEATRVLDHIRKAREQGIGIVFISDNLGHAYEVGDRFVVLNRGSSYGEFERARLTKDELRAMMEGQPPR